MKHIILTFLLLSLSMALKASEVILNTTSGNSYYLSIDPDDSFQNVIAELKAIEQDDALNLTVEDFHISWDFSQGSLQAKTVVNAQTATRNYYIHVDQKEAENISYLLNTLAYQSLIKITGKKSALTKAGDQADRLHPLRFLLHIFSHDELVVCIRNIRGRTLLWKEFSNRLLESLRQESNVANITFDQVQDVATKLKIDVVLLNTPVLAKDWTSLLEALIQNVGRTGDSKRYDM